MRVLGRAAAVAVSRGVNPTEPHRLSLAAATCCESLAFPNRSGALPATPSGRPVQLYLAQGGAGWLRSRRSLIPASRYAAADRGVRLYSSLPMRPNPDGKRLPSTGLRWAQSRKQSVSPEPRSITLGQTSNKCLVTLQPLLEFKVFRRLILHCNIVVQASKSLDQGPLSLARM
ncbi:putative TOX high mobility group box family member 2 [Scophthalmus maximus]|uniref:Putative TOX high mobility group box family member 2 n=1 Tax=Scophthalmus maximus TaxID=52904 RepID=A0A2U9BFG5_SCOMX|nr:putative TOX high mobility group box family member 2 [Scophthalmus maximus]